MPTNPLVLPLLYALGGYLLYRLVTSKKKQQQDLPYPPGPKGKPIIKNLFDLPPTEQWLPAKEWGKEFGDIIYLNAAGQHIIFLNSYRRAIDLLEKRSSLYSDRLQSPMMELMNITDILPLMKYGDKWRLGRRIFHQEFNSTTSRKFEDMQLRYASVLVKLLKDDPDSFEKHVKHFASGVILEASYGFKIKSTNDPYVKLVEEGLRIANGLVPGAFLVDVFPILKNVPSWMPGAGFKRKAKAWGQSAADSRRIPFELVSESYDQGVATPSLTASWLSRISTMPPEERIMSTEVLKHSAGTAFLAGSETTMATLMNFILHMTEYQDAQHKAQEELDRVIGRERLPDFSDSERLPYMNALIKEVLRCHPVFPLGIPHRVIADDVYDGMKIPEGAAVFGNVWAMARDEEEYGPDADTFRPDRFLESDLLDPGKYVFGFGRRNCPGRYIAENSIFIVICTILQVFSINRASNEDGSEKPLEPRWESTIVTHLLPFLCSFKLRFEGADKLVDDVTD